MNIQNKLRDLKDQKSYSIPAKRVMEHLKPILSKSNDLRQRWMWELLQNASDLGDSVKARFELTSDTLKFSHNGKPFSLNEAYNLIMPDSTKDDELSDKKSVIGQFGTGFISTHILSKIIKIEGLINDEGQLYSFNFHLDRSERNDKDFLIESIKNSEIEYKENLEELDEIPEEQYQTSFTYHINNTYSSLEGQEIVKDGIKSFKELIPYVFAFRPQLIEIEVIETKASKKFSFRRGQIGNDIKGLTIINTICYENEEQTDYKLVGKITEGQTEVAFPIEKIEENQFRILPFPHECPKLFCAFPMIGTSEFNFPIMIHSEKFVPNRERDGIELSSFDIENRARLVEATAAFKNLLGIIQDYVWTQAFNVCSFTNPEINDAETKKWFIKEIFDPIKDSILNTDLIELDNSLMLDEYRTSLSSAYVPYADKRTKDKAKIVEAIHDFAFKMLADQIPCKKHLLNWYEILDFEIFQSEKLDTKKLCEMISPKGNLKDFAASKGLTENETIKYFVDFIKFIIEQEEDDLLVKHELLLNQSNTFTKLKGIKLDRVVHKGLKDDYDEKLKDIYDSLSHEECRDTLLHKGFETISLIEKDDKYDLKDLAKDTDEELRNYEGNFRDEDFLLTLKNLFNWYTTCGLAEDTLINLFPYFSLNKSQLFLNTKTPKELENAFDIEISGKSEVLAKLAKCSLSEDDLEIIVDNHELLSNFIEWLNSKKEDNPDKKTGDMGEEFLYHQLCRVFGENRVLWEDRPEYDFRILEEDLTSTKYYIDAKTTGSGIANSDNVPFFMRTAQWSFLDKQKASDKYIVARVFKHDGAIDVKYLKLNKQQF